MADVVMDDMAIGNPASLWPSLALWASFPGIHIAQFPFQVIGNCGEIFLMQRSIAVPQTKVEVTRFEQPTGLKAEGPRGLRGNLIHNCRLAMHTI
jgi:hypothetical protein